MLGSDPDEVGQLPVRHMGVDHVLAPELTQRIANLGYSWSISGNSGAPLAPIEL